jgi:hypothetical protein
LGAITEGAGKVAKDIVETLIAKVGRKTFQGIANRQRRAVERRAKQRSRTAPISSDATGTNMTICTSSFIRTLTVGSGFSPDLLTPRDFRYIESQMNAGARGLTGLTLSRCRHTAGGEFRPALKTH